MKLSRAAGYALQGLVLLANRDSSRPVPSHELAREGRMPELFLLKALLALVRGRLLVSLKGPHGGYRLARPAKTISLLDVIEAVDGPVRGAAPPVAGDGAAPLDRRLQAVCDAAAGTVRDTLRGITVAALARRGR
jgi:Rrf2 family protein